MPCCRPRDQRDRQRVAVRIGVVGQHAPGGVHLERAVFGDLIAVVGGVAGRVHADPDRDGLRVERAVADLVREGVDAVVSGLGFVGERAVDRQHQRAVFDVRHQARRQRVAFDVRVVLEHAVRGGDVQLAAGQDRVHVVLADRGVVDRADRDRHGRLRRSEFAVAGAVA